MAHRLPRLKVAWTSKELSAGDYRRDLRGEPPRHFTLPGASSGCRTRQAFGITNRHENAARVALDVIGNGWNRIFVSIRDAEHFVSDDAGTTRRAKRGGQGAVTGETKMGIKRIVNRKPIRPSNRALPASFRLRSSPPASSVFVFRPKARTAWTESPNRIWDCRKYFSSNVFTGPVKIRDKLSLKIRDKGGR